jgi:WD40 repeat protein
MAVDAARAKSLFLAASEMADPARRATFLEGECGGNADLRARVEALLYANDAAPLTPLPPSDPVQPVDDPCATQVQNDPATYIGQTIAGRYKLLEEIGEGGMGTVFMALQAEPVRRAVAVKIVKPGMDSKAVLARFEAERQALAMMDHPNIARVLDAGSTESGQPFFVMELVKGTRITKYCDDHRLTPRQRLELFVPVCQAIQHAHQKGVIHRDIKPSNVLVALYDDRPMPKVIDFGLAKAVGQPLTEKTLMTAFGALAGTPEYMSPEQASLNNLDIDTRSDVYSLGVLLYELLTGTTPLDRKSLGDAALLEVLRIVREVDAPRPSAKLSSSEALPTIAANRGTEPAKLTRLMRGEIDWVLLKALEKDRARRYETANGLARDIQRYLADEVVEARAPSTGFRLLKFARRHKAQVTAAALVFLALLAGITGTTFGLIQAEKQRRRADDNAARAESRAAEARDALAKEAQARRTADEEEAKARYRLTRLHVNNGHRMLQGGDPAAALLWFVKAWTEDQTSESEQAHRTRIGTTLLGMPKLATACFHSSPLTDGAIDREGRIAVACPGRDYTHRTNEVYVWNVPESRLACPPLKHEATINCAAVSEDGRMAATASDDGTAVLWETATGERLHVLPHEGPVKAVAFQPGGKLVATGGRELKLWSAASGQPLAAKFAGCSDIWHVSFSEDGQRVLAADLHDKARVWNTSGEPVGPAVTHSHDAPGQWAFYQPQPALSSDGRHVATAVTTEQGQHVNVYEIATKKLVAALSAPHGVRCVCFIPNEFRLVMSSGNPDVITWNCANGQTVMKRKLPRNGSQIAVSPDGKWIAANCTGGLISVWPATSERPRFLLRCASHVQRFGFVCDSTRLMAASQDGTLRVWDIGAVQSLHVKPYLHDCGLADLDANSNRKSRYTGVSYSRDGRMAIQPASYGADLEDVTSRERRKLVTGGKPVLASRFSADGRRAATFDGTCVEVWDIAAGKSLRKRFAVDAPTTEMPALFLDPSGSKVAVIFARGRNHLDATAKNFPLAGAYVWDVDGARLLLRIPLIVPCGPQLFLNSSQYGIIQEATLSHDGRFLAYTVPSSLELTVIEVETGKRLYCLKRFGGYTWIDFSLDDRYILSGSSDTIARVWDARTGAPVSPPLRQSGYVYHCALGPDASQLATLSDNDGFQLWDVRTGDLLGRLGGWYNPPFWYDKKGRSIITDSASDQHVRIDIPRYDRSLANLARLARLYTGEFLDDNDGIDFVPTDEFINRRDDYRRAWAACQALDPARLLQEP